MSTGTIVLEILIWTLIAVLCAWMISECFKSVIYSIPPKAAKDTIVIEPLPHQNVMVKTNNPVMVTGGPTGPMIWNQTHPGTTGGQVLPPPTVLAPPAGAQVIYYVPTNAAPGGMAAVPSVNGAAMMVPVYQQQQPQPISVQQFAVQSPLQGETPAVQSPVQSPRLTTYPATGQQVAQAQQPSVVQLQVAPS